MENELTVVFKCTKCANKIFYKKQLVTSHMQRMHNNSGNTFNCLNCEKFFKCKSYLNYHINRCHSDRPRVRLPCKLCKKSFANKNGLKRHVKFVHQQQKPYSCFLCPSRFTENHIMLQHFNTTHYGLKLPCDICGELLATKDTLKLHIRNVHMGIKSTRVPYITSFTHHT